MPVIWHPPRHSPDPDLEPFPIPEDGLEDYDYSGEVLNDRYQLDKPIGPGGTATVYRGKDLRTGAKVAVKILNANMHEHLLGFFGQEGRVAARHTCPHLVQAIDFGKHEDCAFTVFKFVEGISLFNLGRDNPLPWRRAVRIVIQVLAALDDLHGRGLVHCDLHPSNILVRRDLEGQDFVIVIDLGFAFVMPPRRITNAPEPTKYIFGLRHYIAPERRAGDAPGPRSDLYSLGVLLWELLTAQILPAYELDPGLAIPPVRVIAPGLDIPEALDAIVMRALSDVEHRFRDAQEMAQALRDVLDSTPTMTAATTVLPVAAAASAALVPALSLAADAAPPATAATPLATPSTPTAFDTTAQTPLSVLTAAPRGFLTRKGLSAALSIAFAAGTAVGAGAMHAATPGESPSEIVHDSDALDDDHPAPPTKSDPQPDHEPIAAPAPSSTMLVPEVPSSAPPQTLATASTPARDTSPSRPARRPTPVSRARKGILGCNPSGAQLTSTVIIERTPGDELTIRFNGHPPLGVFGECALKVARTLSLPVGKPLEFTLRAG